MVQLWWSTVARQERIAQKSRGRCRVRGYPEISMRSFAMQTGPLSRIVVERQDRARAKETGARATRSCPGRRSLQGQLP
ncbi:hypothetical protein GCM10010388_49470 [Streptomyces mauvecolor]